VKYVDLVDPVEVVVEMPNSPLVVLVSYQKFKSGEGGADSWERRAMAKCQYT